MSWAITQKPAFWTDFISQDKAMQERITNELEVLAKDPVTPRGDVIKKLIGWENVWRYRIGSFRLIYAADPNIHVINLLMFGPRGNVYERFNYDPEAEPAYDFVFNTNVAESLEPQEEVQEWQKHPEWFKPDKNEGKQKDDDYPLPHALTTEILTRGLVPKEYHDILIACRTELELLSSVEQGVPDMWVERAIDLVKPAGIVEVSRQPNYRLLDPSDLEKFAEGTLRTFLLALDNTQAQLTDWALKGPTLVKGGPGSGKSTVALYRVREMVKKHLDETGEIPRILFTTYTNALTRFSESLLQQLLRDIVGDGIPAQIRITNIDKVVWQIIKYDQVPIDGYPPFRVDEKKYLAPAFDKLDFSTMSEIDRLLTRSALDNMRSDYVLDEFDWVIEGQNCLTLEDYLQANRIGRGIPFTEGVRRAIWHWYQAWRDEMNGRGLYTWGQLRQAAFEAAQSGRFSEKWDYVLIDEAQDLTPAAIALGVELCKSPQGVFLTADANQSLYNQGFSWSQVHDNLQIRGRTRILRRNYRTTQEIALGALDLLTSNAADMEAAVQTFVHQGMEPILYAAKGGEDQAKWIAHQITKAARELRLPLNAAAVLVPSKRLGERLAKILEEEGLTAKFVAGKDLQLEERHIKVMTLHSAKGLEFPIVAIAHVEEDRFPYGGVQIDDVKEEAEHIEKHRRLLYVGCTRAMRRLFLTYDSYMPSMFIKDLSAKNWQRIGA